MYKRQELTALTAGDDGSKTVLVINALSTPTVSTATVKSGPAQVSPGQIFEVTHFVYPEAARLVVYLPHPAPVPNAAAIASVKSQFPGLTWSDDPTVTPVSYLVAQETSGWKAYGQNGKAVKPGPGVKGAAFLLLGPPPSVADRIRRTEPFKRNAFRFTDNLAEANYFLTMRVRQDGAPEYALFDPRVLAEHKDTDYVRSEETNDTVETEINGGKNQMCIRDRHGAFHCA